MERITINNETITPDLSKRYLTDPPFFLEDAEGRVEILREADFWADTKKWNRGN